MSEENRVNVENTEQKDEPKKSLLEITEHEDFDPIVGVKYLSAKEFCETVSSIFKVVFADYEGCLLGGVPQSNQIEIKLYFNHNPQNENSNMPVCCSKEVDADGTKNAMLAGYRRYNNRMVNGDRYFVTEDGKATIAPLLLENRALLNRNNNLDWSKICSEVTDTGSQWVYDPTKLQYTMLSYVDPTKLVELIYGTEHVDIDGTVHRWAYNVRVVNSMPSIYINNNANDPMSWMLGIDRISEQETEKLAAKYGLAISSGLNIVR